MSSSATEIARLFGEAGRHWLASVIDLAYPPLCALTRVPIVAGDFSEQAKQRLLKFSGGNRCWRCASEVGPHLETKPEGCDLCRHTSFAFQRVVRLSLYEDELAAACRRLKHVSGYRLATSLGNLLAEALEGDLRELNVDYVVPVPLHWRTEWHRRYNPSQILAKQIARHLGRPLLSRAIIRTRRTSPQHFLSMTERRTNVRNAFKMSGDSRLKGARILLVDDVMTTGATCHESARALRSAGTSEVYVAVLARGGPRRDHPIPPIP